MKPISSSSAFWIGLLLAIIVSPLIPTPNNVQGGGFKMVVFIVLTIGFKVALQVVSKWMSK